jgi:SHS2 domain-containing protein
MTGPSTGTAGAGPSWELFPHDADVGVRGYGPTAEAAFEQAALALKAVVTDAEVRPAVRVDVTCQAPGIDLLFADWLNAIIYEMAVRRMIFGRATVRISGDSLAGTLWGEGVDRARHAPACEPKGATYTALKVERLANGLWSAACIVDV